VLYVRSRQASRPHLELGTALSDPQREMVVVIRWIDPDYADAFFRAVGEAVDASI